MKIGFNLLFLWEGSGGTGTYVRGLLPALLRTNSDLSLTAFVSSHVPPDLFEEEWSREVEWVRWNLNISERRTLFAQMVGMPTVAARRRLDVLHSPANVGPLVTARTAKVVTLLDLIWLHEGEDSGLGSRARRSMRIASLASARAADRVLAISRAAREDLVQTGGLNPASVDVTPLGVGAGDPPPGTPEGELRDRLAIGNGPIVLSVAQKRRYKRLDTLIRALAELDSSVWLVLPGTPTPHEEELRALAVQLDVEDRVRFPGWVSEEDLNGLYRIATCFALPSRIEGFGLPIVEAMRHGTPVACSNRSALPEVAGDAALLFDPEDQSAVTAAVRSLLDDASLREQLVERGRRRSRELTWDQTAASTLDSYRRAVAVRRRGLLRGVIG
jgi:glycosyltransferase involved in cell wall biosynthesis